MTKTLSETLFEKYCDSHGIRWRPVAVGPTRTPDYDIFLRRFKVVTEVKEITQNQIERQAEEDLKKNKYTFVSTVPGDRVRGKISDAVPQIRARSKGRFPGLEFKPNFHAIGIDFKKIGPWMEDVSKIDMTPTKGVLRQ